MREIIKILSVPVDAKSMDFRLTKLDAVELISVKRENNIRAAEAARMR